MNANEWTTAIAERSVFLVVTGKRTLEGLRQQPTRLVLSSSSFPRQQSNRKTVACRPSDSFASTDQATDVEAHDDTAGARVRTAVAEKLL